MGVIAAVCRELVAAGLAGEQLIAALERVECEADAVLERVQRQPVAADEAAQRRREKDRLRKSAERLRKSADTVSPKEIPPTPPKEITPSSSLRSQHIPRATPKTELGTVLDEERADAVIEHRQRLRKPLTAHAAKLLAGKLAKAPDPNAAADAMIANGWQGFEPEWLDNRAQSTTGPPSTRPRSQNGFAAYALDLARQAHDEPTDESHIPVSRRSAGGLPTGDGPEEPGLLDSGQPGPPGRTHAGAHRG